MNEPLRIVTDRPDSVLAAEYKARLVEAYAPILALLDEITAAGLQANVGTGPNALGKQTITVLQIVRLL